MFSNKSNIILILLFVILAGVALAQTDQPSPVRALPTEPGTAPGCIGAWDNATAYWSGLCATGTGMTANQIWSMPIVDGASGKCWGWASAYVIGWVSCSGSGNLTLVTTDPAGTSTNPTPMQFNYVDGFLWGCVGTTTCNWIEQMTTAGNQTVTGPEIFTAQITMQANIIPNPTNTYQLGDTSHLWSYLYANLTYQSCGNFVDFSSFDYNSICYNTSTRNLEINQVIPGAYKVATFSQMLGAGIGTSTWYQTLVPYANNVESLGQGGGSPLYWYQAYLSNVYTGITGSTQCVDAVTSGQLQGGGNCDVWTSWTPTLTASSGSATLNSSNCRYAQDGKMVHYRCKMVLSVSGASVTYVNASLPVTEKDDDQVASGYVLTNGSTFATSTNLAFVIFSTNVFQMYQYPWSSSYSPYTVYLEGIYEAN